MKVYAVFGPSIKFETQTKILCKIFSTEQLAQDYCVKMNDKVNSWNPFFYQEYDITETNEEKKEEPAKTSEWMLTDYELPEKDEIVQVKYCTINTVTGETEMFETEAQYKGCYFGVAKFWFTIKRNAEEKSVQALPTSVNKIVAWKRKEYDRKSVHSCKDELSDSEEDMEPSDTTSSNPKDSVERVEEYRSGCDSLKKLFYTEPDKGNACGSMDKTIQPIETTNTRKIIKSMMIKQIVSYRPVAEELTHWLDIIQNKWKCNIISVTETKVNNSSDQSKQGFIILYESYEE